MEWKEILSHVDHTLLNPEATWEDIRQVVEEGIHYGCASVCIPPAYVQRAAEYAAGRVAICTVIGFPNGYNAAPIKAAEATHAVLSGAGFGDEGCLAHFFGEQGLTERIVHLVGARVEQILTLQPEVEAQFLREVGAESQRRGTAGVVEKQVMEFVLELFGGHDIAHGLIHFQKGRHEQFGYEAAPVFTIVSCAVHNFPRGPPVVPGPMARPPFVSLG